MRSIDFGIAFVLVLLSDSAVNVAGSSFNEAMETVDWSEFTKQDFEQALGCREVFSKPRPIHGQATWRFLRKAYTDVVGVKLSTLGPLNTAWNGFAVDYYVDYSPGKGRGIFARNDIKKGDLVWSDFRTAEFDADEFRQFLSSIPSELACDVLIWSYVEEIDDISLVMVDLDEMSFCNDGGVEGHNINFLSRKSVQDNYATRYIKAGEEILCHYNDYESEDGWEALGLE